MRRSAMWVGVVVLAVACSQGEVTQPKPASDEVALETPRFAVGGVKADLTSLTERVSEVRPKSWTELTS